MPRVIFKCPHIKSGAQGGVAHLGNYVRYMATREGAEYIDPGSAQLPATAKQQKMVARVLRDFPLSRSLFEYEDYAAAPTRTNASEFISRALEDNYDQAAKKENYVQYIAQRPHAELMGSHALFTGGTEHLVLSQVSEMVANHSGTVWLPIISLRREDAARLGYDSVEQWHALLSDYAVKMADAMKIPRTQFRWYAAFHNESHHPHVHMVCFSANGKDGFLTKEGIAEIKAELAKTIFRQELLAVYQEQTQRRDELTREAGEAMSELITQMRSGTLDNPKLEQMVSRLSERLRHTSGKKQYGYLKAPLKSLVDEIVDELAKDERISKAYELWYLLREEVLRTYREDMPERLPLSQQKEFKRIKNIVIEEAVRLGELAEVFHDDGVSDQTRDGPSGEGAAALERKATRGDARAQYALGKLLLGSGDTRSAMLWLGLSAGEGNRHAQYALAKIYLTGAGVPQDAPRALELLRQSAEQENPDAQYLLGKLLLQGEDVPKDVDEAIHWLAASAEQGNQYAQYVLGKLYLLGKAVSQDRDTAVYWFSLSAAQGYEYAQYFLDHMDDHGGASILSSATRLLYHMGRIFEEQKPRDSGGGIGITDKKLRKKIREKKIAMGHKPDDHEQKMTV